MDRRGFLAGMLAASVAPAIVRAESLMKIVMPTLGETMAINMLPPYVLNPEWRCFIVTGSGANGLSLVDASTNAVATPQELVAALGNERPNLLVGSVLRVKQWPTERPVFYMVGS